MVTEGIATDRSGRGVGHTRCTAAAHSRVRTPCAIATEALRRKLAVEREGARSSPNRFEALLANRALDDLAGFDLVPENRRWLEEGVIEFLLTQRPVEQGAECIQRLFRKVFENENGPRESYTPIDIVTRENLKYISAEVEE